MNSKRSWQAFDSDLECLQNRGLDKEEKKRDFVMKLLQMNDALNQTALIVVLDEIGKITHVNDRLLALTKFTKADLIDQDYSVLYEKPTADYLKAEVAPTLTAGKIWRGEIKSRTKNNGRYWVHAVVIPFFNERGAIYQYISVNNDITERKYMELLANKNKERYRLITENSSDLIATIDLNGNFDYISPSFDHLLGFDIDFLEKENISYLLCYKSDKDKLLEILKKKEKSTRIELCLHTKTYDKIEMEAKVSPMCDAVNEMYSYIISMRDITERKRSDETIEHLAYHDSLTELPNRRYFMKQLKSESETACDNKEKFTNAIIEIDQFKLINDTLEHEVGDALLIEADKKISNLLGEKDIIARLGGDEFTIIFSDYGSTEKLNKKINKIKKAFEESIAINGKLIKISFSMGVSRFPQDGKDADTLLARADTALYATKNKVRNGHAFFKEVMEKESIERMNIERELREAVDNDQLYLQYQPKINLATSELFSFEALIRWKRPNVGVVPPISFIPIAEETGLIHAVGHWVLRKACEQNKKWQDKGYRHLPISVNVSVKQLQDPQFYDELKYILQDTGLDAK